MKLKRSKLRNAIAVALTVSAGTLAAPGAVLAQEQAPQDPSPTQLDVITVTGSRIQSQTMTASSPVTEISAEEFQYTGATKVEDLVNQYPQLALDFDNFQNNPSTGYATVDLREMGPQRTLTLVNGRRIPKGLGETPDISIIPSALIRRVDLLSGGASAVYGSDAVAGVVNFILDDQFEGVSVNLGYSAYQHDNDNGYIQSLMDAENFDYPTGNSGFDGISRNIDLAIGGRFGESGHAMGWVTWRKNEALLQGQRDYSSCALNEAGTACVGSPTADPGNFYIIAPSVNPNGGFYALPNGSGTWAEATPFFYNYAPVNYYQRPDTRFTAGGSFQYEVNEYFTPYLTTMFVNRKSDVQIAPSGAFFTDLTVNCATDVIGSMCADLGITDDEFTVYVAKRNVEGGPRISGNDTTAYSFTAGTKGILNDAWSYDASFTYNRSDTKNENLNDFITTRVRDGLLGCPAGSFDGCIPYDVWSDNVSVEAAQALQGVGIVNYVTTMKVANGFVTGDLGFALPSANEDTVKLVAGYEWRSETYERIADANMATGNFTGLGGPISSTVGEIKVSEFFLESQVPLISDAGALDDFAAELGYRYSNYSNSGTVHTYKVGLGANFADNKFRLRAGFNRAIRAPSITELFDANTIGLWQGIDPCAGANPRYTAEQCALTGVTAAQYGNVAANAAGQYNRIGGGNLSLVPETAETWTVGFAMTPVENLNIAVDYYDVSIEDAIQSIGPQNTLAGCALDGREELCALIRRNSATGDLFRGSDPETSGLVFDSLDNYGSLSFRGIDLSTNYAWDLGQGRLSTSFVGSYVLERQFEPIPGLDVTTYDCAGRINASCNTAEWRHFANLRYSLDRYSVGLRWRYIGEKDYILETGEAGDTDALLIGNGGKIGAYNYLDLSATLQFGQYATWTVGVNNVADKEPPMVGGSVVLNGNSVGGYDQAGRYIFTSLGFKF